MDFATLLITFGIGILASFLNSLVGGGGSLISIPALLLAGLPPHMAVATNRFSLLGASSSSIYRFAKAKKIVWKYIIPLTVFAVVGGILGAQILIDANADAISTAIGVFMLLLLPLSLIKKQHGLKRFMTKKWQKMLGYIAIFAVGIYGGFLGAGAGLLGMYVLVHLFGYTYLESNATEKIPWFFTILITTIIFAFHGLIMYWYGIALLLGMIIGGYVGANVAVKKGDNFLRALFSVAVFLMAVKLIFF